MPKLDLNSPCMHRHLVVNTSFASSSNINSYPGILIMQSYEHRQTEVCDPGPLGQKVKYCN